MKLAILLVLAAIALISWGDEADDEPRPVSSDLALALSPCHPGDRAVIHVIPIPANDRRSEGGFSTTNNVLTLRDFSMLPDGLNRLEVRRVCRGLTGEVSKVVIDLRRPPAPVKFGTVRVKKPSPVPLRAARTPPAPPLPPGLVPALPDAQTNRMSYQDSQLMKAYYSKPGRRNQ
jgi:hypothetical protein